MKRSSATGHCSRARNTTTRSCPTLETLEARDLPSFQPTPVLTYHNNLGRTGQNLTESVLTPDNVTAGTFGRLASYPVDGQVYAQPLYVPGVTLLDGSTHNIVYVATEHDSVYAFDANNPDPGTGGGLLWHVSFIDPANGILPFSESDAFDCSQITPEIGITGTPVIDPKTGIMYVADQFTVVTGDNSTYHQQLHALDITSGQDVLPPVEIQGSVVNDSGSTITFDPQLHKERAALTLTSGVVYVAFASHCDIGSARGWVMGYDASSLDQLSVFVTTPNGSLDTIWQGDGGLAVDQDGNLYFETGNGTDISGFGDDFSEAFLKLDGGDGQTVDDYFIPYNYQSLDDKDADLGSGAPIALPDQPGKHPHLLVGGGKDGRIFLIDRDNMGGLNNPGIGPDLVVQTVDDALAGGAWDTPAYFDAGDLNGPYIYYVGDTDYAKAFQLTDGLLTTSPTSQSPTVFDGDYGATPIISANGMQNGILWALENRSGNLTLHAYDATDLSNELYNSDQVASDRMGDGVKFNSPIIADGEVFVPTSNSLEIFGLFGTSPGRFSRFQATVARGSVAPAVMTALAEAATVHIDVPMPSVIPDQTAAMDPGFLNEAFAYAATHGITPQNVTRAATAPRAPATISASMDNLAGDLGSLETPLDKPDAGRR